MKKGKGQRTRESSGSPRGEPAEKEAKDADQYEGLKGKGSYAKPPKGWGGGAV